MSNSWTNRAIPEGIVGFDSFPSPPNLRLLLSTDAGNYSQLLNWQISERWLLGKRYSEDVPTSGGENTLRPACVEHAQPESRSRRTPSPNSWARSRLGAAGCSLTRQASASRRA